MHLGTEKIEKMDLETEKICLEVEKIVVTKSLQTDLT